MFGRESGARLLRELLLAANVAETKRRHADVASVDWLIYAAASAELEKQASALLRLLGGLDATW